MTPKLILVKYVSDDPKNIDHQVLMVVSDRKDIDHEGLEYATEILGDCHIDAWAELTGGNFTDTDFDAFRCYIW